MLLALILVDVCLSVAFQLVGPPLSAGSIWQRQAEISAGNDWPDRVREEVVHPYLGYVLNRDHLDYVNEFGFARADADIPTRAPGRLVVGVTGGSVALQFCSIGSEALKRELSRQFPDSEIVLTCLALQGFKQPQQIMAVNYLCCLGAEFDVILNLDGFNEIALAPTEDEEGHTFDLYPRGWPGRFPTLSDARELQMRLDGHDLREQRTTLARRCSAAPWCYSSLLRLCWMVRNELLERRWRQLQIQLTDHVAAAKGRFVLTGPPNRFDGPEERVRHLAESWVRCSLHLRRCCDAIGARYVHALQPNQYVPESKPLSKWERIEAVKSVVYAEAVALGYPVLQEESRRLQQEGIRFVDLTQVFAGVPETVYSDECCHVNERGYELLAARLAEEIRAVLTSGGQ